MKSGLMSGQDKKKLDEFSAVSNETGKFMGADGKWRVPKDDDSWASEHLAIEDGANGLDVKRSSGATEFTIPIATSLGAGVMSSSDKARLDALNAGTVTGIKGSAESEYRAGDVELTAANVGAAASDHTHSEYAAVGHNHDTSYATINHNHDSAYAAASHTHSNYALTTHNHDSAYAAASHTHSGYASSTHNHDSSYAAKSHSHSEYAAASHGNHVPTAQTASNKVFLRNDNSWQTVTPANIGAAASDHTHSNYALTTHNHDSAYAAASHTHSGYASSTHNHDSSYAAKSHSHSEYAAASHGNHVPTTQTASNKVFLRNDNSWQTVTPANIGAAAASHNHDSTYAKLSGATFTGNLCTTGAFEGAYLFYFTCQTAGATAAKTAKHKYSVSFSLVEETYFTIWIGYDNTAAEPTLNIDGTGALPIRHYDLTGTWVNVGTALKKGHYWMRLGSGSTAYYIVCGPLAYYKAALGI